MMKTFLLLIALVMGLNGTAGAGPDTDWRTINPAGIHYAVERNSLHPDRWQAELQQTKDCIAPCIVDFDDRMSALHLRYKWKQLNPKKGVYDFSDLGAILDIIHDAGKMATLVVMTGKYTPEWVFKEGGGRLKTKFRSADEFSQKRVPTPWDPVFLAAHGDMITALTEFLRETPSRYNTLVLVKNGGVVAHSGETRLMPTKAFMNSKDRSDPAKEAKFLARLCADYAQAGYTEKKIVDAVKQINIQISEAFPDKYLGLAFIGGARRFPTVNGAGKCTYPEKNRTLNAIIKNMVSTYGKRAIINNTVLTEVSGQPGILEWVRPNGGQIGFQLDAKEVGCRQDGAECSKAEFKKAVRAGTAAGAVFIEVHDGNIHEYRDILPEMNKALVGR